MQTTIRIGTRGSPLALVQTRAVIAALAHSHGWSADEAAARTSIVAIKTSGDRVQDRPLADIGGKGLFAKEIEEALIAGDIDCAVHSLKDMPTTLPSGLVIDCILPREDPRDAFISKSAESLMELPLGATIGTCSVRRQAQLLNARPDLKTVVLRGNVETRLARVDAGEIEATILALAGLKRLNKANAARHIFSTTEMLPAVAQGAIGVETRLNDIQTNALLQSINHTLSALAVTLERAFQAVLDGSCKTPIAGLAEWSAPGQITFRGCALSPDGKERFDVARAATLTDFKQAMAIGCSAGEELLSRAGRQFFQI